MVEAMAFSSRAEDPFAAAAIALEHLHMNGVGLHRPKATKRRMLSLAGLALLVGLVIGGLTYEKLDPWTTHLDIQIQLDGDGQRGT